MSGGPQLSPQSYLYQRARQIQEELLPRIAEEKEKIQPLADSQIAQLTEMEAVLKAEFEVLQAASTVLPAEVVPISELGGESNVVPFQEREVLEGGAE